MATKRPKKLKMSEIQPQPYEVNVHGAQQMLGFDDPASVRKLRQLGKIEGRKIGHDIWYDTRTIEKYLAERRSPGRPRLEETEQGRGRKSPEDAERDYQREYKRDYRAGIRRRDTTKAPGRAGKAAPAARGGAKAAKKGPAKGRGKK